MNDHLGDRMPRPVRPLKGDDVNLMDRSDPVLGRSFRLNENALEKAVTDPNKEIRLHVRALTHREMKTLVAQVTKCIPDDFEGKAKLVSMLPDALDMWAHGEDEQQSTEPPPAPESDTQEPA